jgi:hypothetical protein
MDEGVLINPVYISTVEHSAARFLGISSSHGTLAPRFHHDG